MRLFIPSASRDLLLIRGCLRQCTEAEFRKGETMLRCWVLLLAMLVLCAGLGCAEGEALPEFADRR